MVELFLLRQHTVIYVIWRTPCWVWHLSVVVSSSELMQVLVTPQDLSAKFLIELWPLIDWICFLKHHHTHQDAFKTDIIFKKNLLKIFVPNSNKRDINIFTVTVLINILVWMVLALKKFGSACELSLFSFLRMLFNIYSLINHFLPNMFYTHWSHRGNLTFG